MHSFSQDNFGHPALEIAVRRLEQLNPDQFEIYFEHRVSTRMDSKDQEIDTLSRAQDVGLAIRLIKDRKLGFSYTTSLAKAAIEKAVETASEVANFMPEDENLGFFSFGTAVYPSVDNYDAPGLKVALAKKMDLAKNLEAQCREVDRRVTAVRSASISESSTVTQLVDSHGEQIQHKSTGFTASITCKAESGGHSQMGSEFHFSNYLDNLDIGTVAKLSAQWAVELLGAENAPTMTCPAVLRNSVVADLLEFLSDSFSAEEIEKGRSMLGNKLGQHLFSDSMTLINDGLMPGGMGTTPFDAEGTPSKKTILIDGGFISDVLYDRYYGKKKGKEPSGCSVRTIKSSPTIGFSNLYLKPGKKSVDSMTDGISKGVLITDLMGLHTANPVTGDFSLGASGILIENNKLTRPVRGFAVAGNIIELFRRVTDIGSDLKFFGRTGAPSIRISEISIGGS